MFHHILKLEFLIVKSGTLSETCYRKNKPFGIFTTNKVVKPFVTI